MAILNVNDSHNLLIANEDILTLYKFTVLKVNQNANFAAITTEPSDPEALDKLCNILGVRRYKSLSDEDISYRDKAQIRDRVRYLFQKEYVHNTDLLSDEETDDLVSSFFRFLEGCTYKMYTNFDLENGRMTGFNDALRMMAVFQCGIFVIGEKTTEDGDIISFALGMVDGYAD